jgi:hypothetical protein
MHTEAFPGCRPQDHARESLKQVGCCEKGPQPPLIPSVSALKQQGSQRSSVLLEFSQILSTSYLLLQEEILILTSPGENGILYTFGAGGQGQIFKKPTLNTVCYSCQL